MKKRFLLVTAIAMSIAMTACQEDKQNSESSKEIATEVVPVESVAETAAESLISENSINNEAERNVSTHEYTIDNISFSVNETWEEYGGQEGSFIPPDRKSAYSLQGVSNLGSYTPETFYQSLILGYKTEHEIISSDEALSDFTTADGIQSKIGRIEMSKDNLFFSIDVLIVPQKNTVVTFASQTPDKSTLPIDIREITNTAKINIAQEDYIYGNTFIASDDSELCLNDNGEFIYYQSKDDHNKPYCTGKYEVYHGQDAIDKVDSMTDYGLTKEEQEQTLSANMNGYKLGGPTVMDYLYPDDSNNSDNLYQICKDSYYAVILHNEKLVESGNTSDMGNDSLYIGFYIPEINYADMINAGTANYVGWTLKGNTD